MTRLRAARLGAGSTVAEALEGSSRRLSPALVWAEAGRASRNLARNFRPVGIAGCPAAAALDLSDACRTPSRLSHEPSCHFDHRLGQFVVG